MKPSKSFRDLIVWQKAHAWVLEVYRFSHGFPKEELYGLTSQLRRAVVSVPSNIVEGFKRRGPTEKVRFMNIAEASLAEATYQLMLAEDLGYGAATSLVAQAEEVDKLLNAYSSSIRKND